MGWGGGGTKSLFHYFPIPAIFFYCLMTLKGWGDERGPVGMEPELPSPAAVCQVQLPDCLRVSL